MLKSLGVYLRKFYTGRFLSDMHPCLPSCVPFLTEKLKWESTPFTDQCNNNASFFQTFEMKLKIMGKHQLLTQKNLTYQKSICSCCGGIKDTPISLPFQRHLNFWNPYLWWFFGEKTRFSLVPIPHLTQGNASSCYFWFC